MKGWRMGEGMEQPGLHYLSHSPISLPIHVPAPDFPIALPALLWTLDAPSLDPFFISCSAHFLLAPAPGKEGNASKEEVEEVEGE